MRVLPIVLTELGKGQQQLTCPEMTKGQSVSSKCTLLKEMGNSNCSPVMPVLSLHCSFSNTHFTKILSAKATHCCIWLLDRERFIPTNHEQPNPNSNQTPMAKVLPFKAKDTRRRRNHRLRMNSPRSYRFSPSVKRAAS